MSEKEKFPSEAADRFQVRLSPGLRDRIKAHAEAHGRSMNTEIVRVLEEAFPEPLSIDQRVDELLEMVDVLEGAASAERVRKLVEELKKTVQNMANGKIKGLDEGQTVSIRERLEIWEEYKHTFDDHSSDGPGNFTIEPRR